MTHILAIDQGTTSSRAIVFDGAMHPVGVGQQEFKQHYPQSGWVEHDPLRIWQDQLATARDALAQANIGAADVAAIGITNQRETTVVWDRRTGEPYYNAIVWQDTRTDQIAAALDLPLGTVKSWVRRALLALLMPPTAAAGCWAGSEATPPTLAGHLGRDIGRGPW